MNLRQKYKREKKRNEELKRMLHEWNADVPIPNLIRISQTDIKTLCAEEVFSLYYHPPEEYTKDVLMKRLCDSIKPFVNFETVSDDVYSYLHEVVKVRATLRVLDCRKDY